MGKIFSGVGALGIAITGILMITFPYFAGLLILGYMILQERK